jgi:NADPH:quinone reductase-like Zn-dependent oxidoreductase
MTREGVDDTNPDVEGLDLHMLLVFGGRGARRGSPDTAGGVRLRDQAVRQAPYGEERPMQAVVFHQHGGPEVLHVEDVPRPTPGPGEVLLRVRATAVNRTLDCAVRARPGAYGAIPMPHISGAGPAGEVAEVGEGVEGYQPGDRVVSFNGLWCGACRPCLSGQNNACLRMRIQGVHTQGGYAEFALAPARNLIRLPGSLSFEEATALMPMAPTAWHLLIDRAQLRPGETVLILAAGGALGTAGVQVAKLVGSRVIAAAGADWKLTMARDLN